MNAHVDRQQLTRELEEMKDKGMRGAIIWDMGALIDPDGIIPAGPPFLGPESVASIHHVLDQADRLGLEIGLSSASSWNAGGPWISSRGFLQDRGLGHPPGHRPRAHLNAATIAGQDQVTDHHVGRHRRPR